MANPGGGGQLRRKALGHRWDTDFLRNATYEHPSSVVWELPGLPGIQGLHTQEPSPSRQGKR